MNMTLKWKWKLGFQICGLQVLCTAAAQRETAALSWRTSATIMDYQGKCRVEPPLSENSLEGRHRLLRSKNDLKIVGMTNLHCGKWKRGTYTSCKALDRDVSDWNSFAPLQRQSLKIKPLSPNVWLFVQRAQKCAWYMALFSMCSIIQIEISPSFAIKRFLAIIIHFQTSNKNWSQTRQQTPSSWTTTYVWSFLTVATASINLDQIPSHPKTVFKRMTVTEGEPPKKLQLCKQKNVELRRAATNSNCLPFSKEL